MKHINAIELGGFQSHGHTDMLLVPGLNIITGPSDSGKTAIIRAIRWALYNEPAGDAMLNARIVESHGEAFVCVMFSDNHLIFRRRGKSINEYEAGNQTYTGFGTGVPLEITQIHGMPKAVVGDQEISLNIHFQLDPPFLLSETSGAAARLLGKLAGTEEIDAAIKDINSELHRIRQHRTTLEALIESTERDLEQYDDLDRQCEQAAKARALWTTSAALMERALQLKKLREACTDTQEHIWYLEKRYIALTEGMSELEERLQEAQTVVSDHKALLSIQTRYVSNRYQLAQIINIMKRTAELAKLYSLVDASQYYYGLLQRLADLHRKNQITATMRNIWTQTVDGTGRIVEASEGLHTLSEGLARITLMQRQFDRFEGVSASVERQKSILKNTADVESAEHLITAAQTRMQTAETLQPVLYQYFLIVQGRISLTKAITQSEKNEKNAKAALKKYLEDLGVCPLCGNRLDVELIAKGA